jgi:hypothetical protein
MWHVHHVCVIHVSKLSSVPERKRVSALAHECHVSHYRRLSVITATCLLREQKSCGTRQVQHGSKSSVSNVYTSRAG